MKFDELEQSKYTHLIIFGAPKTGKTKLVGGLAKRFKLKWIDLEAGSSTLRQLPKEYRDNIDIVSIPDSKNFPIACQTLLKMFLLKKGRICYVHGNWDCPLCLVKGSAANFEVNLKDSDLDTIWVIDTGTQLALSFMNNIMKDIWKKDPDEMPEWKHYAHQGNLMAQILSEIQVGKYHIAFISHETEAQSADNKKKLVPVAGTRNLSATAAKYFDEVVYCEVRAMSHKFGSGSTYQLNVVTGSRENLEIAKMSEPSLVPFFDKSVKIVESVGSVEKVVENKSALSAVNVATIGKV